MQVFFILFSVYFAVYQYINSKCLYRTHVKYYRLFLCINFGNDIRVDPNCLSNASPEGAT